MKTNDIVGWMVVNSNFANCGIYGSRKMARWAVKSLFAGVIGTKFKVCKIQVVH